MTEYTESPEAIAQYMSSRERTMHWVESHVQSQEGFYSPSVPPTAFNDPDSRSHNTPPSDAESEAESVVSLPPRMILKYNDGRADVPISHWHYDDDSGRRSKTRPRVSEPRSRDSRDSRRHHSHRRTHSYSSQPHNTSTHHSKSDGQNRHRTSSLPAPEEIRILPPSSRSISQAQSQSRSKSHSRDSSSPPDELRSSAQQNIRYGRPQSNQPAPPVVHSQSQPTPSRSGQSHQSRGSRAPPAIVYAPSRSHSNYAPPVIFQSSQNPQYAPGVAYSHSTPVPLPSQRSNYSHAGATPYPPIHGTHLSSVSEEGNRNRPNSRMLMESAVFIDDTDLESQGSGSTYYVLPTAGQKIHIIAPPEGSIYTATSTTQSPTSPQSSGAKKPFFSRLFSKFSTPAPTSKGLHRLQRRHSTGGTGRKHQNPR